MKECIETSNSLTDSYFELMNSDLKEFVFKPVPLGINVKCIFIRNKQGIDRGINPAFYMYYEREQGKKVHMKTNMMML